MVARRDLLQGNRVGLAVMEKANHAFVNALQDLNRPENQAKPAHRVEQARPHDPVSLTKGTVANVHDSRMVEPMRDAIRPLRKRRAWPRTRPDKLHTDKGYDDPRGRQACPKRDIEGRVACRGVQSSQRLGRHRWEVERSLSWLNRFRRLKVGYEWRADIHQAVLSLGGTLIGWTLVQQFCQAL